MIDFIFGNKFEYNKFECMSFVATAIIGAGAVAGASTIYSSKKAADTQSKAAQLGADTQLTATREGNELLSGQFDTTRADLLPYSYFGQGALDRLGNNGYFEEGVPAVDPLRKVNLPTVMTQEQLEATPGYQFTKTQGLKATQNAAAARGLGVSGGALKAAATFATGLADTTYANRFREGLDVYDRDFNQALKEFDTSVIRRSNVVENRNNAYTRLMGVINVGQNAAARTGIIGSEAAKQQSANLITGGNAVQTGLVGGANAQAAALNTSGQAVSKFSNDIGGYAMYKGIYGNNNWGSGTGGEGRA